MPEGDKEKIRKILQKSAYRHFGSPDISEAEMVANYDKMFREIGAELDMSSSEQDGDSSTGQPTTSDNKIPVKEKMKNTNVSCFDVVLMILGC